MPAARKDKPVAYPPEHLEAYQTLGIVLGAPDFEKKMEALRYLIHLEKQKPT